MQTKLFDKLRELEEIKESLIRKHEIPDCPYAITDCYVDGVNGRVLVPFCKGDGKPAGTFKFGKQGVVLSLMAAEANMEDIVKVRAFAANLLGYEETK